jgi:hypothetical protein
MKIESVGRSGNLREVVLIFDEAVTPDQLQKIHDLLSGKEPHCSTCQCSRIHAEMPLGPDGKTRRTRSWHHG